MVHAYTRGKAAVTACSFHTDSQAAAHFGESQAASKADHMSTRPLSAAKARKVLSFCNE